MTRPRSQLWTRSTNSDIGRVRVSCIIIIIIDIIIDHHHQYLQQGRQHRAQHAALDRAVSVESLSGIRNQSVLRTYLFLIYCFNYYRKKLMSVSSSNLYLRSIIRRRRLPRRPTMMRRTQRRMTVTRSQGWELNSCLRWGWDKSTVSLLSRLVRSCERGNNTIKASFYVCPNPIDSIR